jgi:hypothetical protein
MSKRGRERLWFTIGLIMLGLINVAVRWPANTGSAHPSEWFAFYFTPAIAWGLLFAGICWAATPAPDGGRKRDVLLPLRGICIAVLTILAMGYVGSARSAPLGSPGLCSTAVLTGLRSGAWTR